jgi:hypothetical protein
MDLHLSLSNSVSPQFEASIIKLLLELLAINSPSQLLPNLSKLNLNSFRFQGPQCEKLIAILSTRRSHLHTFRLTSQQRIQPHDDILVALRELGGGGMKIHIGGRKTNHV